MDAATSKSNTTENTIPSSLQSGKSTSDTKKGKSERDSNLSSLVVGQRLMKFVGSNQILLNALLRANYGLLEKSLKAMVQVP